MALARYRPQLATLVKEVPRGDEWLHEIKFDGYRIGCDISGDEVSLISRNGNDWTRNFHEIADAARGLETRAALLDGEVAIQLPDGRTSFQALQNLSTREQRAGLVYFVFDLLHLDGTDLSRKPLEERKAVLADLLRKSGAGTRIRYTDHVAGNGSIVLEQACRLGLEGVVSKRRDQPYRAGRNDGWLKTKCIRRQEFVIGGFTDPEGSRAGLGALLVGVYGMDGKLVFAGKVGTGFTQNGAAELRRRLERIERRECPFDTRPAGRLGRNAHWVRPELVAEVAFTEWTGDGKVRHPSFQGLRGDKKPRHVVAEQEAPTPAPKRRRGDAPAARIAEVSISHPERVLYPELGLTKLDLARYYEQVARWMLPHLKGRPLTLVRCPKGLGKGENEQCFYMKHSNIWAPEALRRVRIQEKTKVGEYLIADSLAALISLVQMDILEIHTWNSTFEHMEQPDRIVLDIDPGPDVSAEDVVRAARLTRSLLEQSGLASFVKTTGGAGLHVVAPIVPGAEWSACLEFSRSVAQGMVQRNPSLYTVAFRKSGRERKILVDYLRNNRTNTSVAAFSTRARPNATVSVPLAWSELKPDTLKRQYTVLTLPQRLARLKADPWRDYWETRQKLPLAP
jgi:bifunctional non-homologous end joining protein LigD